MKKLSFLKKPKILIPLVVIVALVIFFVVRGGGAGDGGIETAEVVRTDIAHIINESGTVEPAREVMLAFGSAGQVGAVSVVEGDRVEKGDELAVLTGGTEYANLLAARANLHAQRATLSELIAGTSETDSRVAGARLRTTELALESARSTQDLLVENARRQLFSNDLRAYLEEGAREESSYSYTPPTISGTYVGEKEGEYVLKLYSSGTQSGYSFRYSGIEEGVGPVSTVSPEPLGTKGLFIQFPDGFARSFNLEWVISVPNTRSVTYTQLRNAYDSARQTRIQAIAHAEANLDLAKAEQEKILAPTTTPRLELQRATVAQAEATVAQAEAAYENARIVAPFAGIVTDVSVTVGERMSPGMTALALISDDEFEIVVNVPEADIALLEVGDVADVVFDAYDGVTIPAIVVRIAPRAIVVDGVTVVKVTVQFSDPEQFVRQGFSADVDLYADERISVLAVPSRAIIERDGKTFVRVVRDSSLVTLESLELVAVEVGLRGSGGLVEIVGGVEEGDTVVTFLSAPMREELEDLEQLQEER